MKQRVRILRLDDLRRFLDRFNRTNLVVHHHAGYKDGVFVHPLQHGGNVQRAVCPGGYHGNIVALLCQPLQRALHTGVLEAGHHDALAELPGQRRAQQGDSEAFRLLVEAYQTQVYRLALRLCGEAAADDVTQEAFLAAWRALPEFRGTCRFSTWLYRLTTNAAIDWLRREKRHRGMDDVTELELPDDGPGPQDQAEQAEAQQAVRRALSRLSEEHRQVLLLRYMQELDYAEIAAALEISEGTVKSRISRAKMRLRELLDGSGNLFDGGAVLQTEISERREQP